MTKTLKWRPIASAPKDRSILIWREQANCFFIGMVPSDDSELLLYGDHPILKNQMFYWMPLPDPPKKKVT